MKRKIEHMGIKESDLKKLNRIFSKHTYFKYLDSKK